MRRSGVAAIVAAAVTLLATTPQAGASATRAAQIARYGPPRQAPFIQELDFVFIPDPFRGVLGQAITWKNVTPDAHTSTGAAPLTLWDSGIMNPKAIFAYTFTAAGIYPYICRLHESFDMVSAVGVPDQVDPPGGPVGTVFTVTVATVPAPTDFVYDVQKKEPGGSWQDWMSAVTSTSVQFDSTGKSPGTYRFRSRLHRVSDDASSDYSPGVSISVTP